ncbi:MAG: SRPBCC domain-containing protein [Gemmatimonadales bacterium]|nr:SRPBCC domain-containing protein [Gemmatimonadales bacterium]
MLLSYAGTPTIRVPVATVWTRLLDPVFVNRSAPGFQRVEVRSAGDYTVLCEVQAGFFTVPFRLDILVDDVVEHERCRIRATGTAKDFAMTMESAVRLSPLDDATTSLGWQATITMADLPPFARPLVETAGRLLTEKFWEDFATRVEAAR